MRLLMVLLCLSTMANAQVNFSANNGSTQSISGVTITDVGVSGWTKPVTISSEKSTFELNVVYHMRGVRFTPQHTAEISFGDGTTHIITNKKQVDFWWEMLCDTVSCKLSKPWENKIP